MLDRSNENRAAEMGPSTISWWRDWRGECAALVASGPSAKGVNYGLLKDRIHVAVVKNCIELCPFAEVVYGCDAPWWEQVRGLPKFNGLKLAYDSKVADRYKDIRKVQIREPKGDKMLFDEPASVGAGGNSGFQLVNLVAQFGATGILLIGFDMQGEHWFGRNNGVGMHNPSEFNFDRWRKAFAASAPGLRDRGIDVVNASPSSKLTCFRRDTVEGALMSWGL